MFKPSTLLLSIVATLALTTTAAMAESTVQKTVSQTPAATTKIGVTTEQAHEAMTKAAASGDTGALVRTEPPVEKGIRKQVKQAKDSKSVAHPASNSKTTATTPRPAGVPANKTTGTVTNTTTPSMAMGITGTVPGADATTGDATNTRDNAHKGQSNASGATDTTQPTDAMGNRGSSTPNKNSKPSKP